MTTLGEHLVDDVLPAEYRGRGVLTKSKLNEILVEIAKKHPDKYPEIVTKLNAGLNEVLRQPDIQARLKTLNIDYRENTPDDFKSFVVTETEKWGKVVKDAGIKLG